MCYWLAYKCTLFAEMPFCLDMRNHHDEYQAVCHPLFPLKVLLLHYFSGHRKCILGNLQMDDRIRPLQELKDLFLSFFLR